MSQLPTNPLDRVMALKPAQGGGASVDPLARVMALKPQAQPEQAPREPFFGGPSDFARGYGRSIMGLGSQALDAVTGVASINPLLAGATIPLQRGADNFRAATQMRQEGTYGPSSGTVMEMAGGATPQIAAATGLGVLAGPLGPTAGVGAFMGASAAPVMGQVYGEARDAGQSPQMAGLESVGAGAITGATSFLPGAAILSKTPIGGQVLQQIQRTIIGRLGMAATAEIVQEATEGAAQSVLAIGMREQRLPTQEELGQIVAQALDPKQAIVAGVGGGAARGAVETLNAGGPVLNPPQRTETHQAIPDYVRPEAARARSDDRITQSVQAVAEALTNPPPVEQTVDAAPVVEPQAQQQQQVTIEPDTRLNDGTEVFTGEQADVRARARADALNQSRADGEPTYSVMDVFGSFAVVPQLPQRPQRRGSVTERNRVLNAVLNPSQRGYTTEGSLRPTDVIPSPDLLRAREYAAQQRQAPQEQPTIETLPQPVARVAGSDVYTTRQEAEAVAQFRNARRIPGDEPVRVQPLLGGAGFAVSRDTRIAEMRERLSARPEVSPPAAGAVALDAVPPQQQTPEQPPAVDTTGDEYRGTHRAPTGKYGEGSLDAMDRTYPEDVYSANAARLYGDRVNERMDAKAASIIKNVRGKPDAAVTIYRAVPKGVQSQIAPGDWVTTVREYAADHGERFDGGYDIISRKVKASELFTEGNSLHEYGWNPQSTPVTVPVPKPDLGSMTRQELMAEARRLGVYATGPKSNAALRERIGAVSTDQGSAPLSPSDPTMEPLASSEVAPAEISRAGRTGPVPPASVVPADIPATPGTVERSSSPQGSREATEQAIRRRAKELVDGEPLRNLRGLLRSAGQISQGPAWDVRDRAELYYRQQLRDAGYEAPSPPPAPDLAQTAQTQRESSAEAGRSVAQRPSELSQRYSGGRVGVPITPERRAIIEAVKAAGTDRPALVAAIGEDRAAEYMKRRAGGADPVEAVIKSMRWDAEAEAVKPTAPSVEAPDTPIGRQYRGFKAKNPDAVILMRVGDFYETFGDDARRMSRALGLTLTSRGGVAMAGVPYDSLETYLQRAINAGIKVAVADMVGGPEAAKKPQQSRKEAAPTQVSRTPDPATMTDDQIRAEIEAAGVEVGENTPEQLRAALPEVRRYASERGFTTLPSDIGGAIGKALVAGGSLYSKTETAANAFVVKSVGQIGAYLAKNARKASAKGSKALSKVSDTPAAKRVTAMAGKAMGTKAGRSLHNVIDKATSYAEATAMVLQEQIIPQTLMDSELLATIMEAKGQERFTRQQGLAYAKKLAEGGSSRLLGIEVPKKYATPTNRRLMWEALEGHRPIASLPAPLRPAVENARKIIDDLGERAVQAGIIRRETYERNKGTYLSRLYDRRERERLGLAGTSRRVGLSKRYRRLSDAFAIVDGNGNAVEWGSNGQFRFESAADRDTYLDSLILTDAEKILRSNPIRKVLKVTAAQIADPATIDDPAAREAVETAIGMARSRYTINDPKSLAELEQRGLIMDAAFPVAKTIVQLGHDVAMAEMFNKIADRVDWASETQSEQLTHQIPDQPRYGSLRGKYVSKPTFDQLTAMVEFPSVPMQYYDDLMRLWKKGKTIYNPATHGRNIMGNVTFADFAGISPTNPANAQYYATAMSAIMGRESPRFIRDLYETGMLGTDLASAELTNALEGAGTFDPNKPMQFFDRVMSRMKDVDNGVTTVYQMEDAIFKIAAYAKQRANGASKAEAEAHVRRWFPFYDQIPDTATTRGVRRTVMPFGSFFYEAVRIGANALRFQPITLAKWTAAPVLLSLYAAAQLGLDDEDREIVFDGMRGAKVAGQPIMSVLLPFKDQSGRMQQFDMTNIIPYASLIGARVERDADEPWWQRVSAAIITGNPLGSLAVAGVTNRDPYFDRRIVQQGMTPGEAAKEAGTYLGKTLLPPLTPGVGTAWNALTDDNLPRGTLQKRDPTQQRVRSLIGVDLRTAEPNIFDMVKRFKDANNLPENVGVSDTTPRSRASGDAYQAILNDDPDMFRDAAARLAKEGSPIKTTKDVRDLINRRHPLRSIRVSDRRKFYQSLADVEKRAVDSVMAEYATIQRRAEGFARKALRSKE